MHGVSQHVCAGYSHTRSPCPLSIIRCRHVYANVNAHVNAYVGTSVNANADANDDAISDMGKSNNA